uniref:Uncharacterized protein n=1 Tax=Zea mays TaxID=4577 RepID=A0A804NTZ1_MAIZE
MTLAPRCMNCELQSRMGMLRASRDMIRCDVLSSSEKNVLGAAPKFKVLARSCKAIFPYIYFYYSIVLIVGFHTPVLVASVCTTLTHTYCEDAYSLLQNLDIKKLLVSVFSTCIVYSFILLIYN